nr:neurofilament medium polypeptide-like [Ipomoea batatas]
MKSNILSKDIKNQAAENGKKRKRSSQVKENGDSVKEEKGLGTKTNANDLIKSVGFRQNGSRRKSKPRRAAERSLKEVRSAQKGFIGDAYSESQGAAIPLKHLVQRSCPLFLVLFLSHSFEVLLFRPVEMSASAALQPPSLPGPQSKNRKRRSSVGSTRQDRHEMKGERVRW